MIKKFIFTLLLHTPTLFPMHRYEKIDNISFDDFWNQEEMQKTELTTTSTIETAPKMLTDEDIVSMIDKEINQKYPASTSLFSFLRSNVTEIDCFKIIDLIQHYSENLSNTCIEQLVEKNETCKKTIAYFTQLALHNIENVTIDTIETIKDHTQPQHIQQLNLLPLSIKKFVMDAAYEKEIKYSYDITLSGHTDTITFFDITAYQHLTATSSSEKDKTVCLWDLTTGKSTHTFDNDKAVCCLRFNNDGSYLAMATNNMENTSTIKILDTQSTQYLYKTQINYHTLALRYTFSENNDDDANTMLTACGNNHNDSQSFFVTIFSINKNYIHNKGTALIQNCTMSNARKKYANWAGIYRTIHPYICKANPNKTLTITKTKCPELYLCQQAVKNTPPYKKKNILDLAIFQKLTEYEKNIIHKQLTDKQDDTFL